ncbi:solute carrier organic anion transporter family member 2B1-like [Melitaea cinxia]|uniref:solute carrier organic anion transporter family member 2B1-like n=1 Tax=Melitaea cinxia TaxID=113334 RepID=UPI001E27084C|nr:solute carrier organic anion transporter family member 2B1-like [Melitaea cinxia]
MSSNTGRTISRERLSLLMAFVEMGRTYFFTSSAETNLKTPNEFEEEQQTVVAGMPPRRKIPTPPTPRSVRSLQNKRYPGREQLVDGMEVIAKLWFILRKYILTLARFDLFLQGALLIVVFLESNVYLLLRRNAGTGYLASINEDWVKLGVGGAEFLLGGLVAWCGRGWRHFALSGWLGITAVSGLIVLAFPFPTSGRPSVELCGGGPITEYSEQLNVQTAEDDLLVPRTVFLVLTAILCGLTKISVWAHGITYLDDHEPQSGPYFYGILISIRLSVGLSATNWLRSGSVRDDWYEAHVSLSMLTLMFSILFSLFPRRMEGYKEFEPIEYNCKFCILTPIGRMLKNKALMLQTFALSLINTAAFGYVNYDTASIQAKFQVETIRQDMRTSRTILEIFRSLVVIFFVSIFRMRFSGRRSDGVKSHTASKVGGLVCVLVAAFFAVLTGLSCRRGELAGLNGEYQQPGCSSGCGCASETYGFSPVCILNTSTTYFSPCHAGCRQYEDLNGFLIFDNCDCGPHRAIRGSCTLPDCWLLYNIYIVFFTVALAASAAACLMQGMAILRSVPRRDKPIAVGVSFAIVGLLSNVIGHFVYMVISHFTCAYEQDGECLFHHFTVWTIGLASIILSVLSGTFSILASRYRVTPKVLINNIDDS